ncbi:hypothetical protein GCM10010246_75100 [Streptomyces cuspidosporus]|uniref:Uncharacterized protein n=1 Tax=Streptomyces cuspidosporus TaxID=66882 RepID=A0ABP5U809_9ACTN
MTYSAATVSYDSRTAVRKEGSVMRATVDQGTDRPWRDLADLLKSAGLHGHKYAIPCASGDEPG